MNVKKSQIQNCKHISNTIQHILATNVASLSKIRYSLANYKVDTGVVYVVRRHGVDYIKLVNSTKGR